MGFYLPGVNFLSECVEATKFCQPIGFGMVKGEGNPPVRDRIWPDSYGCLMFVLVNADTAGGFNGCLVETVILVIMNFNETAWIGKVITNTFDMAGRQGGIIDDVQVLYRTGLNILQAG